MEVTERVISTLLPMEWKLLFHFRNAKKFEKIPKKCLTALWRSYIIALASRGIRNAETRYTTEAVKLFAGVVQW